MGSPVEVTIYTIGHSNHPLDVFLGVLTWHGVQTVADARSHPRSRYYPHFNQRVLIESLWGKGIGYEYFGDVLGGHPDDNGLYDGAGHVVYERIAGTSEFRAGIRNLMALAASTKLVIMCTEGDPTKCHRHTLLARCLLEQGVNVIHIGRAGELVGAEPLLHQPPRRQLPLIVSPGEDRTWRSPKRIR